MCRFVDFSNSEFIFIVWNLFNILWCICISSMSLYCNFVCYDECRVKVNIKLVNELWVFSVIVRKFVKEVFSVWFGNCI